MIACIPRDGIWSSNRVPVTDFSAMVRCSAAFTAGGFADITCAILCKLDVMLSCSSSNAVRSRSVARISDSRADRNASTSDLSASSHSCSRFASCESICAVSSNSELSEMAIMTRIITSWTASSRSKTGSSEEQDCEASFRCLDAFSYSRC